MEDHIKGHDTKNALKRNQTTIGDKAAQRQLSRKWSCKASQINNIVANMPFRCVGLRGYDLAASFGQCNLTLQRRQQQQQQGCGSHSGSTTCSPLHQRGDFNGFSLSWRWLNPITLEAINP